MLPALFGGVGVQEKVADLHRIQFLVLLPDVLLELVETALLQFVPQGE